MQRTHKQVNDTTLRTAQAKFTAHSRENERENSIHDSPAQAAQRMKLQSLFGNAVQRQETEDDLKTAQRVEDKDELQKKSAPAQMKDEDDGKTSQLKMDPTQRKDDDEIQAKRNYQIVQRATNEEELKQAKFSTQTTQLKDVSTVKPNNTGLPDNLKSGIENLSGMSMDNVKVHYNSSQPTQLNALAYAQGTDIHVAPGQEQHLPHEAWHVVQQAQGRVKPTMQMKEGVPVNDDKALEHEADVMGAKAVSVGVAQRKSIESAPIDFGPELPMQMKMGFELQVMNEIFHDKTTGRPAEGKEAIATDGTIGIERDGKNPEFVTAAYDEKNVKPEEVGEEVGKVITNYGGYLNRFPEINSNLERVTMDGSLEDRTVDVQATGGFDLSEVEGWYQEIINQTKQHKGTNGKNRFIDKRITPFQARDTRFDTVHNKGGRMKRTKANYDRITASVQRIPNEATRPKVRGLMALINTNIMAIMGAVSGDKDAPGIKALTAILPKSNLSTLYKHSFDMDDKKNFDDVNQSIKLNESHPWHKPIVYDETVEDKSRLGWEHVRNWVFYPHLYMDDIMNGVEPMWVFEGFSEVHDDPYARDSVYEDVIETHGEETAMKLASERLPAREKWYPRINNNFAEAIIEMRELGYGDLPLSKIGIWAMKAFEVYATYRNSNK